MHAKSHSAAAADIAALLFAAQAAVTVMHRLLGRDFLNLAHGYNVAAEWVFVSVWAAATVAALMKRSTWALVVWCCGVGASTVHGLMLLVATSSSGPHGAGIPFLLAAAIEAGLAIRAAPLFRHRRQVARPLRSHGVP
jgi:hypothetical protein